MINTLVGFIDYTSVHKLREALRNWHFFLDVGADSEFTGHGFGQASRDAVLMTV
jgi:hypothetical protein